MNATAHVNVIDGTITIDVPDADDTDLAHIDGRVLPTQATVEPWGAEDEDMGRADTELAAMGWERTGDWSGTETAVTATVRPAP